MALHSAPLSRSLHTCWSLSDVTCVTLPFSITVFYLFWVFIVDILNTSELSFHIALWQQSIFKMVVYLFISCIRYSINFYVYRRFVKKP